MISKHHLTPLFTVLFVIIMLVLAILPMICGEISAVYFKKTVEDDSIFLEYQFRVETYLGRKLEISIPSNASDVSLSVTSFDYVGNKLVEENSTQEPMLVGLDLGKHVVDLKLRILQNAPTSDTGVSLKFEDALAPHFPQVIFILIALACSLVFSAISFRFLNREMITRRIVLNLKLLTSLIAHFQIEMANKQLRLGNVERIRISYSSLPSVRNLRTIAGIEAISDKQVLGDPEEKRAALILQAIVNLSDEIGEAASRYQASFILSLEQLLDKSLVSSVYKPKIESLIQRSTRFEFAIKIKQAMDHTQVMMEAENIYLRLAKIVSAAAVGILAMIILGYQPTDYLVLKLPILFYTISNLLGFITHSI